VCLGMPADAARFVEDAVEFHESTSAPEGLRSVQRSHLHVVQVVTKDEKVLQKIGLPNHETFDAADLSTQTVTREFKWMTHEECLESGVRLSEVKKAALQSKAMLRSSSLVGLQGEGGWLSVPGPASRQSKTSSTSVGSVGVKQFLAKGGIRTTDWTGEKESRTLESLEQELRERKCFLIDNGKHGVQRLVRVITLRLRSPDEKFVMVQVMRTDRVGNQHWRTHLPETEQDLDEIIVDGARRIVSQSLGLEEDDVEYPGDSNWEYHETVEDAKAYPGLRTKYEKYYVDAILRDDDELIAKVALQPLMSQ